MLNRLFAISLGLFLTIPASAHHNWMAIYDVNTDIEIEATIKEVTWRNPHVRVSFIANEGTADEKIYTTESNSVASLTRMGVTRDLLAAGTPVLVAGYQSRNSDSDIFMNHLLLPDSQEIVFLRTAEPRWPEAKRVGDTKRLHGGVIEEDYSKLPTSIFNVWTTTYGNPGSHHALGKDPVEWTEKGQKAVELARAGERNSSCASKDSTLVMGSPYPLQLIDKGDTIIIHAEEYDSIRTVYMDVPHNDPGNAGILGYSTGKMIRDTLSVTTTYGSDSTEQLHETFNLSDDHQKLMYTQVVIDPQMRVSPTVNKKWWQYQPGASVQAYDCSY